ncbi:TIM barrel protein [Zongyangia hominis]|uniref:TIM barrel protein n=1 Tax=Zongyangia hominis TaxID=2763677 RepID=A0A926EC19_9FIRM|nr:TIM barrel protein [Zongyangia hominis]MBC8569361.1 TIM barrel protein [Zongyangia hominis]
MTALFGPAGNSESFTAMGYKSFAEVPAYIERMGLDAYEYQCGHGVRISDASAAQLGERAREKNVTLSLHAPYYISLSSLEEEKRDNSIRYILQSAKAAKAMGAGRIVVHSGSCGKMSREEALALAMDTMGRAVAALDEAGYGDIHICPETMGKVNQLGTLDEVLALCGLDERLIPCIDFGHLNARTFGGLKTFGDYEAIFDAMEDKLGEERMRRFHAHFSKIEYTEKGGEKAHLTFEDKIFGPDFTPVAELLVRKNCAPTIICESAGTQAEDAGTMKRIYEAALMTKEN